MQLAKSLYTYLSCVIMQMYQKERGFDYDYIFRFTVSFLRSSHIFRSVLIHRRRFYYGYFRQIIRL